MSHTCDCSSRARLAHSVLLADVPWRAVSPLDHAMLFRCVVHPKGLDPFQAAKAWHLRIRDGLTWKEVRAVITTDRHEFIESQRHVLLECLERRRTDFVMVQLHPRTSHDLVRICPRVHGKPRSFPRLPPVFLNLPPGLPPEVDPLFREALGNFTFCPRFGPTFL